MCIQCNRHLTVYIMDINFYFPLLTMLHHHRITNFFDYWYDFYGGIKKADTKYAYERTHIHICSLKLVNHCKILNAQHIVIDIKFTIKSKAAYSISQTISIKGSLFSCFKRETDRPLPILKQYFNYGGIIALDLLNQQSNERIIHSVQFNEQGENH